MDKELEIGGKEIHYRLIGRGRPVMLVHGFGEMGTVWDHQIDYLKDKYQLIVPDLPGSGRSGLIDDMTVEGMAEVLRAIFEHEGLDKVATEVTPVLIGHSMGGYITLAFVEK